MDSLTDNAQKLYVAYFSRPADPGGLKFWQQSIDASPSSIAAMAAAFAVSDEYRDTYAGKPHEVVIDTIYRNLFNRAAEPAALQFWGNALSSRAITIDDAVMQISAAARNEDATTFRNKVLAASVFTATLDASMFSSGYSGARANETAKTWLSAISSDATLAMATAPAALDAVLADLVGQSDALPEALTPATDTLVGTSGNDQFLASVDALADSAWNTLSVGDTIDGGAGIDTLAVAAFTRLDGSLLAGIKQVEILELHGDAEIALDGRALPGLVLVDGSAATGKLNLLGGAGMILKGGAGNDILSIDAAAASAHGGAGDDVLKVLGSAASAAVLNGGDGRDMFDLSAFRPASIEAAVLISDLGAGESLAFVGNPGASFVRTESTAGAGASLAARVAEAAKAAAAAGSHGIAWFRHDGDTFVLQDVDGSASFNGNADILVKLSGTFDLSLASFEPAHGMLVLF